MQRFLGIINDLLQLLGGKDFLGIDSLTTVSCNQ